MAELNQGLTSKEVKQSRSKNGSNQLKIKIGPSFVKRCIKAFLSSSQILLLVAIGCNLQYGFYNEYVTYGLGGIYILKGLLTLFFTSRKNVSYLELLKQTVQVLRDGKVVDLPGSELVVGDFIYVSQNDTILADGIIRQTKSFALNESIYNHKNKYVTKKSEDPVYLGSTVLFGSAIIEITSVGNQTILGKCAKSNYTVSGDIKKLTKAVSIIALLGVLMMIGVIAYALNPDFQLTIENLKEPINHCFGLLCILGLNPALLLIDRFGYLRERKINKMMMKQNSDTYLKQLGDLDLLILDKKETFTKKELEVVQSFADDQDLVGLGLGLYAKDHIDQYQHAFALFASEKKFNVEALMDNMNLVQSSTNKSFDHIVTNLYVADRGFILYSIGSVDDLLDVSKYIYLDGKEIFFGAKEREVIGKHCAAMRSQGQEVLGIAYQVRKSHCDNIDHVQELCFVGLVGLQHPLKEGVIEGLQALKNEHVEVMMMSDERTDLVTIAALKAGMIKSETQVLTDRTLETMTERRLLSDLSQYRIFTNLNGNQKERMINALKKNYQHIGIAVRSIEDYHTIHSADLLLTGKNSTPAFISLLGQMQLEDLDLKTFVKGVQLSRIDNQRLYKMVNFVMSGIIGMMFIYAFGFMTTLGFNKEMIMIDPYILIGMNIGIYLMAIMLAKYDSKKKNKNTAKKIMIASVIEGIMIGLIGICIYLCTWYFKHDGMFFEIGICLLMIFASYCYDNHMKTSYSFHFIRLLLKGLLLGAITYYYMIFKGLTINDGLQAIYLVLPLSVMIMITFVKKIIYGKENRLNGK